MNHLNRPHTPRQTPHQTASGPAERFRFWQVSLGDDLELLQATLRTHTYARHAHEGYAIGVTERGSQAFTCRGEHWCTRPGSVLAINPEEAHDGCSAVEEGVTYRMLYLRTEFYQRLLDEFREQLPNPPFFQSPVFADDELAGHLLALHRSLEGPTGRLDQESQLVETLGQLAQRHANALPTPVDLRLHQRAVRVVRDYLHAHLAADISLSELAALVGMSRFHLLRVFRGEMGLPPYAYLTQLRLRKAKQLLRSGESAASVATAVGYVDQSHLIKRFKAAYGITPGQLVENAYAGYHKHNNCNSKCLRSPRPDIL